MSYKFCHKTCSVIIYLHSIKSNMGGGLIRLKTRLKFEANIDTENVQFKV